MKVVINTCYGSFGLSKKAMELYSVLKYGENFVKDLRRHFYIESPPMVLSMTAMFPVTIPCSHR